MTAKNNDNAAEWVESGGGDVIPLRSTADPRDTLRLEVRDVHIELLTGIYSEETHLPQPLRISVVVDLDPVDRYAPETPLAASKNYLDLRWAMDQAIPRDRHFTLIEAVADHIAETLFAQDRRVARVEIAIVKLAISTNGESIGITLARHRR